MLTIKPKLWSEDQLVQLAAWDVEGEREQGHQCHVERAGPCPAFVVCLLVSHVGWEVTLHRLWAQKGA